jgi:hypothetical protein
MSQWVILKEEMNTKIYGLIEDDGLMKVTAVIGYEPLDKWLESNSPAVKETPETPEAE